MPPQFIRFGNAEGAPGPVNVTTAPANPTPFLNFLAQRNAAPPPRQRAAPVPTPADVAVLASIARAKQQAQAQQAQRVIAARNLLMARAQMANTPGPAALPPAGPVATAPPPPPPQQPVPRFGPQPTAADIVLLRNLRNANRQMGPPSLPPANPAPFPTPTPNLDMARAQLAATPGPIAQTQVNPGTDPLAWNLAFGHDRGFNLNNPPASVPLEPAPVATATPNLDMARDQMAATPGPVALPPEEAPEERVLRASAAGVDAARERYQAAQDQWLAAETDEQVRAAEIELRAAETALQEALDAERGLHEGPLSPVSDLAGDVVRGPKRAVEGAIKDPVGTAKTVAGETVDAAGNIVSDALPILDWLRANVGAPAIGNAVYYAIKGGDLAQQALPDGVSAFIEDLQDAMLPGDQEGIRRAHDEGYVVSDAHPTGLFDEGTGDQVHTPEVRLTGGKAVEAYLRNEFCGEAGSGFGTAACNIVLDVVEDPLTYAFGLGTAVGAATAARGPLARGIGQVVSTVLRAPDVAVDRAVAPILRGIGAAAQHVPGIRQAIDFTPRTHVERWANDVDSARQEAIAAETGGAVNVGGVPPGQAAPPPSAPTTPQAPPSAPLPSTPPGGAPQAAPVGAIRQAAPTAPTSAAATPSPTGRTGTYLDPKAGETERAAEVGNQPRAVAEATQSMTPQQRADFENDIAPANAAHYDRQQALTNKANQDWEEMSRRERDFQVALNQADYVSGDLFPAIRRRGVPMPDYRYKSGKFARATEEGEWTNGATPETSHRLGYDRDGNPLVPVGTPARIVNAKMDLASDGNLLEHAIFGKTSQPGAMRELRNRAQKEGGEHIKEELRRIERIRAEYETMLATDPAQTRPRDFGPAYRVPMPGQTTPLEAIVAEADEAGPKVTPFPTAVAPPPPSAARQSYEMRRVGDSWFVHDAQGQPVSGIGHGTMQGARQEIHDLKIAQRSAAATPSAPPSLRAVPPPASRPLPEPKKNNYITRLSDYTDTLYREVGVDDAELYLPTSRNLAESFPGDVYFANTPDLALSQGGKGVHLAFDAGDIEGVVNRQKPGWELSWEQGTAEFYSRHLRTSEVRPLLREVTVDADAVGRRPQKMRLKGVLGELEQAGWTKTENPDGSTTWRRPETGTPNPAGLVEQPPEPGMVRLYRGETIPATESKTESEWLRQAQALRGATNARGRWFTDTPEKAEWYVRHSADWVGPEDVRMVYVDVPQEVAERWRVSNLTEPWEETTTLPGGQTVGVKMDPRRPSRRPEEEYFLPADIAATRRPLSEAMAEAPPPSAASPNGNPPGGVPPTTAATPPPGGTPQPTPVSVPISARSQEILATPFHDGPYAGRTQRDVWDELTDEATRYRNNAPDARAIRKSWGKDHADLLDDTNLTPREAAAQRWTDLSTADEAAFRGADMNRRPGAWTLFHRATAQALLHSPTLGVDYIARNALSNEGLVLTKTGKLVETGILRAARRQVDAGDAGWLAKALDPIARKAGVSVDSPALETAVKAGIGQKTPRELGAGADKLDIGHDPIVQLLGRLKLGKIKNIGKPHARSTAYNVDIEAVQREGMWGQRFTDRLGEATPDFVAGLANTRAARATGFDEARIRASLAGLDPVHSPRDVMQALANAGADRGIVQKAGQDWADVVRKARDDAVRDVSRPLPIYNERNIDRWAKTVIPFHFWQSRASAFILESMARNPAFLANYLRVQERYREASDNPNLPPWMKGMLQIGGTALGMHWYGNPMTMLLPSIFLQGLTPESDDVNLTWAGNMRRDLKKYGIGLWPSLDTALNVLGVYGPESIQGVMPIPELTAIGRMIDYGLAQMEEGMGAPIRQNAYRWLREEISGRAERAGVPGISEVPATDPQAYLKDLVASKIEADHPELVEAIAKRYDPNATQEDLRAADEAEAQLSEMLSPGSDEWNAAWKDVAGVNVAQTGINAVSPLPLLPRQPFRDEQLRHSREGREAIGANRPLSPDQRLAFEMRGMATTPVTSPLPGSDQPFPTQGFYQEVSQYYQLGSDTQKEALDAWSDIAYGEEPAPVTMGGEEFTTQEILALPAEARLTLADAVAAENGTYDDIQELRRVREAYAEAHPTLAAYLDWAKGERKKVGDGEDALYPDEQAYRDAAGPNKSLSAYYDSIELRHEQDPEGYTAEDLARDTFGPDAYLASIGVQTNVYAPPPEDVRDESAIPYYPGESRGTGTSGETPKDPAASLQERVVEYLGQMARLDQIVQRESGGRVLRFQDLSLQSQAYFRFKYGDLVPQDAEVEEYLLWQASQPPGTDSSPAAYLAFKDQWEMAMLSGQGIDPAMAGLLGEFNPPGIGYSNRLFGSGVPMPFSDFAASAGSLLPGGLRGGSLLPGGLRGGALLPGGVRGGVPMPRRG